MLSNTYVRRITLALFALAMIGGGIGDLLLAEEVVGSLTGLGYPEYLARILGVWKILGVAAITLPLAKGRLREWAWAGFFFDLSGAFVSHVAVGDAFAVAFPPLMLLGLGAVAYFSQSAGRTAPVATPAATPLRAAA